MRNIRRLPVLLVVLLLTACGDGLGPRSLVGEWVHRIDSTRGPWNSTEIRPELRADGSYTWAVISHAEWGRPGDKLLSYTRVHGRYEVEGDSLFLAPQRSEWREYLTGTGGEADVSGRLVRYRARVVSRRLVLNFISYPLDAPEETTMVFRRD